ncbi:RNA polymerase sigma factor (sigma-70 family) [Streptomyces sp. V3I8]|uniref:RNA polymerase sigma factor n=1 Tax=Streptomyces sp. V3I8 TaxID=3042279 RepID=UPI0027882F9D|nr:sigma-70 family RNA polymerase sigma factor [Streptomyces sp. V3I8]MDQ1037173.1 RNA polymerase sigma factor (sigma-70 family) [Streptomyces sp. V3I8]
MTTHLRTRVRAGDPRAFAELFDSYSRAVYNHAFRLTADWSTAEDVMASTFMEAWRLRDRVDPEGGSLRPWLLGIATNTARNQFRSNRRYRRAAGAAAAAGTAVPDHADEVADRLDDRRRLATALTALATLRRPEREVIALCLGEGLDYEAAAEALGIPVGTVASRLSRARKKLRTAAGQQLAHSERELGPATLGVAPEKDRGNREGRRPVRQTRGDHAKAIRPAQEGNR